MNKRKDKIIEQINKKLDSMTESEQINYLKSLGFKFKEKGAK